MNDRKLQQSCLHADMLLNVPSKSRRHGKQQPSPFFNTSEPRDFPWNGCSLFYWTREWSNLRLPLAFLSQLPPFRSPRCAACVFSAFLVWFGNIWHSCGLVNTSPNSVHLESLPHTSSAISDSSSMQCTYTHSKWYTTSNACRIKHALWICWGGQSSKLLGEGWFVLR